MSRFDTTGLTDAMLGGLALGNRRRDFDLGLAQRQAEFEADQETLLRREAMARELAAQRRRSNLQLYQQYNPPRHVQGPPQGPGPGRGALGSLMPTQTIDPGWQAEADQFGSYPDDMQGELLGQMGKSHAEQQRRMAKEQEAETLIREMEAEGFGSDIEHNLKTRGLLEYAPRWWRATEEGLDPAAQDQRFSEIIGEAGTANLRPEMLPLLKERFRKGEIDPSLWSQAYRQQNTQWDVEEELAKLDLADAEDQLKTAVDMVKASPYLDAEAKAAAVATAQQNVKAAREAYRQSLRRRLTPATGASPASVPGGFSGMGDATDEELEPATPAGSAGGDRLDAAIAKARAIARKMMPAATEEEREAAAEEMVANFLGAQP
jgi:hypothetical protein